MHHDQPEQVARLIEEFLTAMTTAQRRSALPFHRFRRPAGAGRGGAARPANGVELLALTDHDEIRRPGRGARDGGGARAALRRRRRDFGFLGRRPDGAYRRARHSIPRSTPLVDGLRQVRGGRDARAGRMAAELDKVGIHGAYEGALKYAGNPALISAFALCPLHRRARVMPRTSSRCSTTGWPRASRAMSSTPGRRWRMRWAGSSAPAAWR